MELRKLKASISESLKTLDKNKVLASFRKQVSSCKPIRKDIQVAERAKAEGNRLYADIRNHDTPLNYNVLHLYNKSIAYAPVGSEELASAYSNKSALLKSMRKYSECITEIDQGIKISQSVPLKIKLLCRKSECLTALGLCENTRCLEKAKFFLSKLENTEEKLKKMLSKLIAKTQRVVDEGKLDTPKKNRRKMEASIELAKAENHSVWSSVQLEFSEKFGRNLAAKRDFEPGQILFVEKPYSSCLSDSRIHMYCSLCFEYLYTIVACEHCPWRSYCSEKCKDEAWNEYHKMECSVLCNMKTSSLPESDISYLACFLISIFFKALKEAGSLRQMQDEVESIDDSSDVMSKGFTSNGEFSSYKSLYSLPIRNHDEDSYQLSLMCALTSLMGIAKYSQVFGSTYDVHEMKKLKKNDDAIFVGALLLKFSLDIGDCTANANLADPSNDEILSREEMFESYRNSMAELDEIPTDSSVALTSMLIIRGCVPNVQICATFGNKYIVYALQPIKAGSQLSVDMYNSSIFDLSPKSRRQEKHQILYKCPCDCEACTDDWSEILGDLLRGVPDVLARDSMIAHKVVPEVNSVVREWKENAHKQNYPTIKQVTKIRSAVLNAYKHASMPSQGRAKHHRYNIPARHHESASSPPTEAATATTSPPQNDPDAALPPTLDSDYFGQDACEGKYCGAGRECEASADGSVAVCVCARRCARRHRPVCASDGKVYANHCELHRAACKLGSPLTSSRLMRCLHRDDHRETPKALPLVSSTTPAVTSLSTSESSSSNFGASEGIVGEADSKENLVDEDNCSAQEYEIMKDNLLLYNHARLLSQDNHSKEYLVSIMFSHYDQNNDGQLEREELEQLAEREELEQLSKGCSITHMIGYDDADADGKLNINEFYMAFSKLYSVSVVSLDKTLEVNHIPARVGDNVEIKCDVTGSPPPPLVWRRYNADLDALSEPEMRIFNDGSLYLTRVQLIHAGNYTCHALSNKDVVQTHVLTVHTIPEVRVTPRLQSKRPGEEATMRCHVVGEPLPRVEWLKNDEPLRQPPVNSGASTELRVMGGPQQRKYDIVGNGTRLVVRDIGYADTGAYMCQASSIGGVTRDISSLVVQEQPTPTAPSEERRFFSFHEWGISIYEPSACRLYHQIKSTDIIPGTQEHVCAEKGVPCSWGRAINVANRYVYVSQPEKDRILVISKIQMVVVDVVTTDKYPVDLQYVPALDQVWVLNWRSETDQGVKTIQVIRDAAQKKKHRTVHPEPIDGQFDLVRGLYIPDRQDIGHVFKYGYVTHTNQRGMYKLDLANMRYTRSADLAPYNCVPAHIQFPALYGFVILQCEEPITGRATGQLLLDYLTDTVLTHKPELRGRPTVSPDSRHLVTLDHTPQGAVLVVEEILPSGLNFIFDVKTSLNISDITFYPSQTTHGYDLYASSMDSREDILFVNLSSGKVEMITGVGKAMPAKLAKWAAPNRPIASSGTFSRYMVSPSADAVFVLNGETRTVNCEIGALVHPSLLVWFSVPALH